MTEMTKGSCNCGTVSYQVEGDFDGFFLCHCRYCQKDTGSAFASNLFSKKAAIEWLSGEDKVTNFNLPNTRHVRSFCSQCGTAVPNFQKDESLLLVPAGSVDSEINFKPTAHLFCSSKANWETYLDSIPQFDKFPE